MVKRKDNLELGWAGDLHLPHREWPSVVWKALKQVAHDDPEHSSSRGAIEEMTSTSMVFVRGRRVEASTISVRGRRVEAALLDSHVNGFSS